MNVPAAIPRLPRPTVSAASLAVLSLGAAAIHFAVIPEHLAEWWAVGLFFSALGWFQALWAIGYLRAPERRLAAIAVAVNVATVVLWAWTRAVGLPFGPDAGTREAIGAPDVLATVLELGLAVGLLGSPGLVGSSRPDQASASVRLSGTVVLAAAVALATTLAMAVAVSSSAG